MRDRVQRVNNSNSLSVE